MNPIRLDPADGTSILAEILADLPSFWGERDLRPLHQPFWLRQSADSLVIRDPSQPVRDQPGVHDRARLVAYLLGVVTADRLAYVHLVAVRTGHRKRGLGARLYRDFLDAARARGADHAEAITTPTNLGSIAFHERLGFTADLVPDYSGPAQPRVVFRRSLTPL